MAHSMKGAVALLRRARKEVADILATEGYFKPSVEGRSTRRRFPVVVAGARTTIASVEIGFTGGGRDEGAAGASTPSGAGPAGRPALPAGRLAPPSSSCSTA
jgi:translocation and assembly module TamA